jgi:hypothetical protein
VSFWAKLKGMVGLGSDRPPVVSEDERLLSLLESSANADSYVRQLRVLWLSGHEPGSVTLDKLVRRMEERFPEQQALSKVVRGLYCSGKVEFEPSPLYQYATSLRHTADYAFEGCLYRITALLNNSKPRPAISLAIRSVLSERPELDLLRWKLAGLLKTSASWLYQAAEKDLGALDGGVALLLASMHMRVAQELISTAWNQRVSGDNSATAEHVRKEEHLFVQLRSELLLKAQQNIARGALNPELVSKCRAVADRQPAVDALPEYQQTLLRSRLEGNKAAGIYNVEQRVHQKHLKSLARRIKTLREQYDGCLGLLELEAEDAFRNGNLDVAVGKFKVLLRRKPSETYYAYRAAQILEGAGMSGQARPFWIHCARTPGLGWRSTLARVSAQAWEFQYEAEALRSAQTGMVSPAAEALARQLEATANDSWKCQHWFGGYTLETKAAALYHLAAQKARDSQARKRLIQKTAELYGELDEIEGLKKIEGPAPETALASMSIPFGVVPV